MSIESVVPCNQLILCRLLLQLSTVVQWCPTLCDPKTAACQAFLSITNSRSLLKLMSIESVMPSNHLIPCHPLLLLSSIFPSLRIFSNESVLPIWWAKYWSFSFSISPSSEYSGLISFRIFFFYFILLYDTVLVLTYINMNPPWVYMCSQS